MSPEIAVITVVLITFLAATVNGALGHGFSSLTVPVALLFYTNRVINPALVLIEVAINAYVLIMNRQSVPQVWRRILPIIYGLIPGVVVGSLILSHVNPGVVKFMTYTIILPLIFLQAAGIRRYIHSERAIGVPFGSGIGILYSVTTISGPPLALMFNNQGYEKRDFRAALGLIRVTETTLTATAYYFLGLYSAASTQLLYLIIPSVVIGIPLGTLIIKHVNAETFRRICMSFDAWVVGFGLSRVLIELGLLASPAAYTVLVLTALIDFVLLYQFFAVRRKYQPMQASPTAYDGSGGNGMKGERIEAHAAARHHDPDPIRRGAHGHQPRPERKIPAGGDPMGAGPISR